MPRAVGQIDATKTEAILVAAAELLAEKGATVSMEQIARRAGVSRQTLYNRYPSKLHITRAVMERRADQITAPLREGKNTRDTLIGFAEGLIETTRLPEARRSLRAVALAAPQMPELGQTVYEAGPKAGLGVLSDWLSEQSRLGFLNIADHEQAAEFFVGMAQGHGHLRILLGLEPPTLSVRAKAIEVADRFMRAYAPEA